MKITITEVVDINPPRGASHYSTYIEDDEHKFHFYKMTIVGAGGEHWWIWKLAKSDPKSRHMGAWVWQWMLHGHVKPGWITELPKK